MSTRGPYFELRRSPIQGRGAFASRKIRAGTRIIEYVGERISHREADARYDDEGMKRHHTFLFAVDARITIDAAVGGNEARFINHSCEPSCEAINVGGRIFIFAKRTILPGEELTYDYGYRLDADDIDEETVARYACRCGAPSCRGTILDLERSRRKPRASGPGRAVRHGGVAHR